MLLLWSHMCQKFRLCRIDTGNHGHWRKLVSSKDLLLLLWYRSSLVHNFGDWLLRLLCLLFHPVFTLWRCFLAGLFFLRCRRLFWLLNRNLSHLSCHFLNDGLNDFWSSVGWTGLLFSGSSLFDLVNFWSSLLVFAFRLLLFLLFALTRVRRLLSTFCGWFLSFIDRSCLHICDLHNNRLRLGCVIRLLLFQKLSSFPFLIMQFFLGESLSFYLNIS